MPCSVVKLSKFESREKVTFSLILLFEQPDSYLKVPE